MSSNVNIIVVEGRMTADPIVEKTDAGRSVCRFMLANNRYYFQGTNLVDDVQFFKVIARGVLAARCVESLKKGDPVLVSGTIKQDKDSIIINATNVKFIGKRKEVVNG